jgi:flagellar hook-associated protein 1 FlgK
VSTFGGLNTAYTGLVAARSAIDVTGQNIANAATAGYTRQRVTLVATGPLAAAGLLSSPAAGVGQGVSVAGITRLGNQFLDARVRSTAASAGYSTTTATAVNTLQTGLNEPGANGLSAGLQDFWSSWQDLSNTVGSSAGTAAASVVIEQGTALASQITAGYTAVANQWQSVRADTDIQVSDLNAAATQVASLNGLIRSTAAAGGSVNEMLDQRDTLTTSISALTGATVTDRGDGTVDVLLDGNPLVTGASAFMVDVAGGTTIGSAVSLAWQSRTDGPSGTPGPTIALQTGAIGGNFALLAVGGTLTSAADSYNAVATALSSSVNGVMAAAGASPFFAASTDPPASAAATLTVVPTDAGHLVTAVGGGADGSSTGVLADTISQLGSAAASPDGVWAAFVTTTAVAAQGALRESATADLAATSASSAQLSTSSVDLDEENVNLLMSQKAYEGSARVLTAMDEMLDTLINKTGLVGR